MHNSPKPNAEGRGLLLQLDTLVVLTRGAASDTGLAETQYRMYVRSTVCMSNITNNNFAKEKYIYIYVRHINKDIYKYICIYSAHTYENMCITYTCIWITYETYIHIYIYIIYLTCVLSRYTYIYIYVCIHILYIWRCVHILIYIYVFIWCVHFKLISEYLCTYVYMYASLSIYVFLPACLPAARRCLPAALHAVACLFSCSCCGPFSLVAI